jgi:hypothetical protein
MYLAIVVVVVRDQAVAVLRENIPHLRAEQFLAVTLGLTVRKNSLEVLRAER